jgi:hypothetical protein
LATYPLGWWQAVKAESRAALARYAPAVTGWRRSGLLAPKRAWLSLLSV